MQTPFSSYLIALWRRIDKRTAGLAAALFILILFGDTLMPLLGHLLHVFIEVIESALEHFLKSVFDLSTRQAQVVLFYSGLAIAAYFSWRLMSKAYFIAIGIYAIAQVRWRAIAESAKTAVWFRILILTGALGATLYLFT